MKKVFMLAVAILAFTFATQAQKFGHVSYAEIVQQLPQYKSAMEELDKYTADYRNQLEALEKEIGDKETKYLNEKSKMTVAQQELAEGELNSLYKRYQDFTQTATNNVKKKQDDLLKPILELVNNAIKNYATKNGFDYIFDADQFIYGKDSNNITNQIKSDLGIK